MAVAKSGRERIEHLRFVLHRMEEIQSMLETAPNAAERERLNAASSENFEAFRLSIGGLVSIGEDDPYASALLDLVDEDPDLNLSQLHNLRHTAPIWRKHIDVALAVDENGPVGLGCEDEDL